MRQVNGPYRIFGFFKLQPKQQHLSEDSGLTTYFFLGVMGWGDGDIQACDDVVVVDGPPQMGDGQDSAQSIHSQNWTGSPMLKLGLQSYFLDIPVDE